MKVQDNPFKKGLKAPLFEGVETNYELKNLPPLFKRLHVGALDDVVKICDHLGMLDETRERMYAFYANDEHQIVGHRLLGAGGISEVCTHQNLMFGPALSLKVKNIICVHNHPTGEARPSNQDLQFAIQMNAAASLLDLNLVDFVVIGYEHKTGMYYAYSARANGVLDRKVKDYRDITDAQRWPVMV